jgi:hypothetical protein
VCAEGVGKNPGTGLAEGTAYWRRFEIGRRERQRRRGTPGGESTDGDHDPASSSTLHLVHEAFGPEGSDDPTAVHVRVANTGSQDVCVSVQNNLGAGDGSKRLRFVSTSLLPAVRMVPAGRSVEIGTFGIRSDTAEGDPAGFPPQLRVTELSSLAQCIGDGGGAALDGNLEPCPEPHGPFLLEDATRRVHLPNSVAYEAPIAPGSDLSGMALSERIDSGDLSWQTTCAVPASQLVGSGDQTLKGFLALGFRGVLGIIDGVRDPPSPMHPRRVCKWSVTNQVWMVGLLGARTLNETF